MLLLPSGKQISVGHEEASGFITLQPAPVWLCLSDRYLGEGEWVQPTPNSSPPERCIDFRRAEVFSATLIVRDLTTRLTFMTCFARIKPVKPIVAIASTQEYGLIVRGATNRNHDRATVPVIHRRRMRRCPILALLFISRFRALFPGQSALTRFNIVAWSGRM